MEMMGGSLSPSFQQNLRLLAEIDCDIRKKTDEIEDLKQEGHKRHKQNPMVQSLLHSIASSTDSGSFSPIQPPMRSVTTRRSTSSQEVSRTRNAITTVEESSSLGASSIDEKCPLATSGGPPPLRPSPTAMSALTVDEDDELVEPDEDGLS